jgi:hypothetical protein
MLRPGPCEWNLMSDILNPQGALTDVHRPVVDTSIPLEGNLMRKGEAKKKSRLSRLQRVVVPGFAFLTFSHLDSPVKEWGGVACPGLYGA